MTKQGKARFTPTEKIGVKAVETILLNEFKWITRSQDESDMGIDLHVEVCEEGTPTGRLLALQVKSGESYWRTARKGTVAFRFDQTDYDYWTDYSLPVLVVLHHSEARKTIWQHICAKTCVSTGRGWKTSIPLTQELTVQHLDQLAKLARRPSLPDVVRAEQERIESLDSRFVAKVVAFDDKTHTTFYAKEDVQLHFEIKGKPNNIRGKFADLFEKGKQVAFEQEEISFKGSRLFERILDKVPGPIKIQFARIRDVIVSLTALGVGDIQVARIDSIPATMTAGTKAFSILGRLHNSPLGITIEGALNPADSKSTGSMAFDPGPWFGNALLQLAFFDQIQCLFEAIRDGARLGFECYVDGNRIFSGVADGAKKWLERLFPFVDVVGKARFIAHRLGVNPVLPELTMGQVKEVGFLYRLLHEGEARTKASDLRLAVTLKLAPGFLDLPAIKDATKPFQIAVEMDNSEPLPFLGNEVRVGPLLMVATSVLLSNRRTIEKALKASENPSESELILEGAHDCILIRKLLGGTGHHSGIGKSGDREKLKGANQ